MALYKYKDNTLNLDDFGDLKCLHTKIISSGAFIGIDFIFIENIDKNLFTNLYEILLRFRDEYKPKPMVVIGLEDLMSIKDINENIEDESRMLILYKKLCIPRYYRFLDFSIWNYYLYLLDDNFELKLDSILETIKKNEEWGLYASNVAREFIELNSRLCNESEIKDIKGHGSHVSPFVFHSEFAMHKLCENDKEKIKKFNWRFLLIDDFAGKSLSCHGSEHTLLTKAEIIQELLADDFTIEIYYSNGEKTEKIREGSFKIEIYCVKEKGCIDDAIEKLRVIENNSPGNNVFDIILIDYLLDENDDGTREYICKFFNQLKGKIKDKTITKAPLDRFWILNISSFSSAMFDHLREEGITYLDENWHISRGGDPINNPRLFKYELYKFMSQLILEAFYIEVKENSKYIKLNKLSDFISHIFTFHKSYSIQYEAESHFKDFIRLMTKAEFLQADIMGGSTFAKSIYKDKYFDFNSDFKSENEKILSIWEHLRHIIYLTAFGSGNDWFQLWEEYCIFRKLLNENIKIDSQGDTKNEWLGQEGVLEKIATYIYSLKSKYE